MQCDFYFETIRSVQTQFLLTVNACCVCRLLRSILDRMSVHTLQIRAQLMLFGAPIREVRLMRKKETGEARATRGRLSPDRKRVVSAVAPLNRPRDNTCWVSLPKASATRHLSTNRLWLM